MYHITVHELNVNSIALLLKDLQICTKLQNFICIIRIIPQTSPPWPHATPSMPLAPHFSRLWRSVPYELCHLTFRTFTTGCDSSTDSSCSWCSDDVGAGLRQLATDCLEYFVLIL